MPQRPINAATPRKSQAMNPSIRSVLVLAGVSIVLAACTTAASPSSTAAPSDAPAPSVAPSQQPSTPGAPVPSGTLTVADGAVVDGPGTPLADAMAGDLSQPMLVRGTLFLDASGDVFFAATLDDATVPTFGEPILRVENYPTDGPTWDIADAAITGLQEANGILFYEDTKLYGTITP
jgi:hypothetical protein